MSEAICVLPAAFYAWWWSRETSWSSFDSTRRLGLGLPLPIGLAAEVGGGGGSPGEVVAPPALGHPPVPHTANRPTLYTTCVQPLLPGQTYPTSVQPEFAVQPEFVQPSLQGFPVPLSLDITVSVETTC